MGGVCTLAVCVCVCVWCTVAVWGVEGGGCTTKYFCEYFAHRGYYIGQDIHEMKLSIYIPKISQTAYFDTLRTAIVCVCVCGGGGGRNNCVWCGGGGVWWWWWWGRGVWKSF